MMRIPDQLNEEASHAPPPAFMTGPWSFRLPYVGVPRGLSLNERPHWRVKAKSTAMVRHDVMVLARAAHIPGLEKIQVDVEWTVGTKHRRDTDNISPLLKAIYDGVGADRGVSARIVEDDAPEFLVKPSATIRYLKGSPQFFTVTITDIGEVA